MIRRMSVAEQEAVYGGNGYHMLDDGRVLLYLSDENQWMLFDEIDSARIAIGLMGKFIDSFIPMGLSKTETINVLKFFDEA